jgi:hypothetical protein
VTRGLVVSLYALLLAASAIGVRDAAAQTPARKPRRDANVITAEELAAKPAQNLYDAVRALRPAWMMRARPTALMPQNEGQLLVYVDGTRFGNFESLRQLVPGVALSVRYYSPSDAEAHFGPGHLNGAIEVITSAH